MVLYHQVLQVKVWATIEVITSVLNPIIRACVMNQSQGHQLLLDVLTTSIAPIVSREVEFEQVYNEIEVLSEFDSELLLQHDMQQEVVKVVKPFITFLKSYDANQVHNMLVIMLDLQFKHLHVVKNYVNQGNAIRFAYEYDTMLIPHHIICFHQLNPIIQGCNVNAMLMDIVKSSMRTLTFWCQSFY